MRSLEEKPAKLVIFQTGVGTRALFAATDSLGLTQKFLQLLDKTTVAARGPKPTGALRSRGVRIDRSAADPFTTKEVLESIKGPCPERQRVSSSSATASPTPSSTARSRRAARR